MSTLKEIAQQVRDCRSCPLYRGTKQAVPGVGLSTAKIFLVGQAPGWVEDRDGKPFLGQAGQFLKAVLKSHGIEGKDVFMSNIVKHYPGRKAGGDNVPPEYAINACGIHLKNEYEALQPALIVAVGAVSMKYFGIKGGIRQNSGKVFQTIWGPVIPILHPAGLMRRMADTPIFTTQVEAINTFVRGSLLTPPPYRRVDVV